MLEQKALEYLVKDRYVLATQWYDRAVIDDPSRIRRIQSQWAGQTEGCTIYVHVERALQLNDKDRFCKAVEQIYTRQGVSFPENTDALFRQASQPYRKFPAYRIPPEYGSIEAPRHPLVGTSTPNANPPAYAQPKAIVEDKIS
ncbi:MAG: hypothetical protein EOO61_18270 [Hymenobacter sp.]|nr:MAG: hypothetical protein EOO61_18270 [Hymenobacter sp.]